MIPRKITKADIAELTEEHGFADVQVAHFDDADIPVDAVRGVFSDGEVVWASPYLVDELDLARLAHGGTLWLATVGTFPVHRVFVGDPPDTPASPA